MPRVHRVERCRKDQGTCKCGTEIKAGMPYLWWSFRFGGTHKRCINCPPKPSELTQSEILSAAYSVVENYDPTGCESYDDLRQMQEDAASDVENIVDEIQDKLDNIESGFGHTELPIYEELDERRQMYEDWKDEIEGVDIDDVDCSHCGGSGKEPDDMCDDCDGSGRADGPDSDNDEKCETCGGDGKLEKDCEQCEGTGHAPLDPDADCIQELVDAIGNCPE